MEDRFFSCESCGNLVMMLIASGVTPVCCGEEMTELVAKLADEGKEKHVPVVNRISSSEMTVAVGATLHPMVSNHLIEFVCLQTTEGFAVRHLKAGDDPKVVFRFTGKPIAVYAYCNVHGLWRLNIKDLCDNKTECSRIAMWF